jgi:hypothetical protein
LAPIASVLGRGDGLDSARGQGCVLCFGIHQARPYGIRKTELGYGVSQTLDLALQHADPRCARLVHLRRLLLGFAEDAAHLVANPRDRVRRQNFVAKHGDETAIGLFARRPHSGAYGGASVLARGAAVFARTHRDYRPTAPSVAEETAKERPRTGTALEVPGVAVPAPHARAHGIPNPIIDNA